MDRVGRAMRGPPLVARGRAQVWPEFYARVHILVAVFKTVGQVPSYTITEAFRVAGYVYVPLSHRTTKGVPLDYLRTFAEAHGLTSQDFLAPLDTFTDRVRHVAYEISPPKGGPRPPQ